MTNVIGASISVFSDTQEPEEIANLIGLPFDTCWRKGEPHPHKGVQAGRYRKENCWRIVSEASSEDMTRDPYDPVGACVLRLLGRIAPHQEKVAAVSEAGCAVEVSIYSIGPDVPPLTFEADVLHGISALGADLDIDVIISG